MPPARKDPPDTNDASRPSTSRDFTPSLAPPVKRARSSNGGGPSSSATVRRQSTGGRQARMEEFVDEKELQERLLMAVTLTADEIMKEEEEEGLEKLEIEKEMISAAAGIVWDALAEDWATDLLAFSKHAGRETIREDDVKLLMRRNPDLLAEIMEEMEEEGEGSTTLGKRKSIGGSFDRRLKIPKEDEITELIDNVTTPRGFSSMTSVVPETPQGIVPLAYSTPMVGRSVSMLKAAPSFSIPSPIREEEEEGERKREGRRPNRSILDDLSATMRDEGERRGEGNPHDDDRFPPLMDLRHPREREEEERRMSMREDNQGDFSHHIDAGPPAFQQPGPSTSRQGYGRAESPELFGKSEMEDDKKEDEHDSFDDEIVYDDRKNKKGGREVDASNRMSESAVLREMLDEEEEEEEKGVKKVEKEDSFDDDDSIVFVEEKKDERKATPSPKGDFTSTSAGGTTLQYSASAVPAAAPPLQSTAAARSTTSLRSSQDSFYNDEIVEDPPEAISPAVAAPTGQQPSPAAVAAQPIKTIDYDSFEDDDDFLVRPPSRSKENISKASGRTTPTITVANGRSTVATGEVASSGAQKKHIVGAFAEDIFGLNSPTVSKPVSNPSSVKQTPVVGNGKGPSAAFSSFSFFAEESPSGNTPAVKREDSDFVDTSTRQTTAMRTPRGRGGRGRGRGLPRKVDPNSKVNRMIREQSAPVRISPRPPSRLNEVVGSFDDDGFDVSGFDD